MTASCHSGGRHILIASFTYQPELDFQGHQSAFSAGIRGTFVVRQVTRHLPRSTGSLEAPACTAWNREPGLNEEKECHCMSGQQQRGVCAEEEQGG